MRGYRSANYQSLFDEYQARCPVGDVNKVRMPWSTRCSAKVWKILYSIFQDHVAFQYMRKFKKAQDGRGAFIALKDHYLGENNVNNMATALEADLEGLSYTGETRRWNFEKYVNKHVEIYNTAEDLKSHGYAGMDDASRVRRLVNGIKTDKLDSVKTRIMSDAAISKNFDRSVTLFKDFIAQKKSLFAPPSGQIAAAGAQGGNNNANGNSNRNGNGNGRKRRGGAGVSGVEVQDRYYSSKEFARLTPEQKQQLKAMREKRQRRGGGQNGGNGSNGNNAQIQALATQVEALVAAVGGSNNGNQDGSGDGDATVQAGNSNRTNQALIRQQPQGGRGNGRN